MSYGIAPSRSATLTTWSFGTNENVGCLSMNRLISQGQAIRSTRAFSRVTHFMRSPLLAAGLVERGLESLRQLHRVVVRPEVHVEESRRVHERVVVDRRDVDALLPER